MKLNPVNKTKNGNRYCGPAVISSVTGCTTDEAAKSIRTISGQRAVRGTATWHLLKAFKQHWDVGNKCLFEAHWRTPRNQLPTLASWLRDNKHLRTSGRVFLIVAGNHFQLVSGRRYVCGITRDVVSIKHDKVKRRARVESVHELIGTPKLTDAGLAALAAKPPVNDRVEARKLARQYGISITLDGSYDDPNDVFAWVDATFLSDEDDPLYDEGHGACGWGEIRDKVETLVDYLKQRAEVAA